MALRRLTYLTALAVSACGSDSTDPNFPNAAEIVVQPSSITLAQGDSVRLVPSVLDDDGALISGVSITFTSANTGIATVSPLGMVIASGAAGTTTIKVKGAGITKDVPTVVTAVGGGVVLTPEVSAIPQQTTLQLNAVVQDVVGNPIPGAPVSFISSDQALATVSPTGLVTSVGPAGTVTVTAISGALSDQAIVVFTQVATTLSLPTSPLSLGATGQLQLGARVLDKVGTQILAAPIVYSSSNTGVATVNAQGVVTSVGPIGTTTITVTSGSLNGTVTINVIAVAHPQGILVDTAFIDKVPYGGAISSAGVVYVVTLLGTLERASLLDWTFTPVLSNLGSPASVAFNQSGSEAYLAGDLNGLRIINVATNTIAGTVGPISTQAFSVVVGPDGAVYLGTDAQVYKIDPVSRTIVDSVGISAVVHLAVHPSQPLVYAQSAYEGKIYEVNSSTMDTIRSFAPAGAVQAIAISLDGQNLYVADEASSDLKVVSLSSGVVTNVAIGCQGWSMTLTADGLQLYVGCSLNSEVKVVNLVTNTVVNTLSTAGSPRRMGISTNGLSIVIPTEGGPVYLVQ